MLLLLAAAEKVTPLQKLQSISGQFWLKVFLGILAFALFIYLFKKIMGMNKIILVIICGVIFGVVGVNWIYNRNEPAFMTPIIEPIANSGFLPTKGAYEVKQQQETDKPGLKKNAPAPASTPKPAAQPAKK